MKFGACETSPREVCRCKVRTLKVCAGKICALSIENPRALKLGRRQVRAPKIREYPSCGAEIGLTEFCVLKLGKVEISFFQSRTGENGATEISLSEMSTMKVGTT